MTTADLPHNPYSDSNGQVVAVLGGTGAQGRGLASRLALAGVRVVIGSRHAGRAADAAETIRNSGRNLPITGAANAAAAGAAEVVIVAVPWAGHRLLLEELAPVLAGKVVVDCVNPLGFDTHGPYALQVEEGSAAEQAAAVLPGSAVVGAFHHVSAALLLAPDVALIETDVLVVGDDRAAVDLVIALTGRIPGMRGVYAGRLRNAGQVEAMTANLIAINRRYRSHAGLRVTGL